MQKIPVKSATQMVALTLYTCGGFTVFALAIYAFFGITNQEKWAHFGDYFSGIVNPIIAFANLILLVVISYQLADREDRRSDRAIKHQALLEFGKLLKYTPRPIGEITQEDHELYIDSWEKYSSFSRDWLYLFPDCSRDFDSLFFMLFALGNSILTTHRLQSRGLNGSAEVKNAMANVEKFYENDFLQAYNVVLSKMRSSMNSE